MSASRSTVLRLERSITAEYGAALASTQQAYAELAETILQNARQRGYAGSDLAEAVDQLIRPGPNDEHIGLLAIQLWRSFFAGFRADELQHEAANFQQRAGDLQQQVEALPHGAIPDTDLVIDIIETLAGFWHERQQRVSDRIDQLINELSEKQRALGSADLQRAHQSDEIAFADQLMHTALAELEERPDEDEPFGRRAERVIQGYRSMVARLREQDQQRRQQYDAFIDALREACTGEAQQGNDQISSAEKRIAKAVADAIAGQDELVRELARMRADQAEQTARIHQLEDEVGERDHRLARYEFAAGDDADEDERLSRYRAAFAEWEQGRDPSAILAQARELERVIAISELEYQQATHHIARRLESLAKTLADLRRVTPITEDPRRFRPRLLGGSPYKLKTLIGLVQACRDASRDVRQYVDLARWAHGVRVMHGELRKLRRVFKEMVKFVADVRSRLGDAPPMSLSIDLGSDAGVASLPAVLAGDIEALLKATGGKKRARDVQPLLEDVVDLFHRSVRKARGEAPPRVEPPKRESGAKACARLIQELLDLAAITDATFSEAVERDFTLSQQEQALLDNDAVLLLAVQEVHGTCEQLASLSGAPDLRAAPVPGKRRNAIDDLVAAINDRVTWLEDLGTYRVRTH